MKYGIIAGIGSERSVVGLGDFFQSMAIEYIYSTMGIAAGDMVLLCPEELSAYEGETTILPINCCWQTVDTAKGCGGGTKPLFERTVSKSILPVFLGVNFISCYTEQDNDRLFPGSPTHLLMQKYAPVGCRDVYTMEFLQKHGVPAYLYGCVSSALPYRGIKGDKVLLVDVPKALLRFMPKELLGKAEIMSNWADYSGLSVAEQYAATKQRYDDYAEHFRLAITSKYHVAAPLYAAGIPVIMPRYEMGYFYNSGHDIRLSTLNPLIDFYMPKAYGKINWNPAYTPYEPIKEKMVELAAQRIRHAAVLAKTRAALTNFYAPRIAQYGAISEDKTSNCGRLKAFISKYYPSPAPGEYYFWGATENLRWHYENPMKSIIMQLNPNLKCAGYIDSFKSGALHGMPIFKPDVLQADKNPFVIVTTGKAAKAAGLKMDELGLGKQNVYMVASSYLSNGDIKTHCQQGEQV